MSYETDKKFIRETLKLARKGKGKVQPNPLVGSIIVKNGEIIGKGYHACFGKEHAEVAALRNAGENARDATLYVNLEPCCHHGKTPPCTDAIIRAGIKRVVVGMVDPNPLVNMQGIETLRRAGIEVTYGVEQQACENLNRVFVKYIQRKLPYVTLKIAQTLDGRIATSTGHSQWITSEPARKLAHKLRAINDAIIVGIGTVLADDPQLTVRMARGKNPIRIVIDSRLRMPLNCKILNDSQTHQTIVATISEETPKIEAIKSTGAHVWQFQPDTDGKVPLGALLKKIAQAHMSSVLIEGGAELATSFLKLQLVDHIFVALAPKILGQGKEAIGDLNIASVDESLQLTNWKLKKLGPDIIVEGDILYPDNGE
ncbi:riboflavin biosynthesis protein RibD [candidate division KSB1 bacterium 4484_87]|nr:MAG: riboflavin biosynthesis protein RibD [candidate division KSB1 bacterium 4484_87]